MKNLIKEVYRFVTLRVLFPWQYSRYAKRPVNKHKVVFIESQLPELSDSLKVLYERMQQDGGYELSVHCLRESFVSKRTFIKSAWGCLRDMSDAGTVFLCDASRLVSCIRPRKETVIAQLWHGCGAFKKFGMSTAELIFGGSRKEYERYPYYGNLDYVTVSSAEVVWAYEEAMNLKGSRTKIIPTGISRTDIFFQEEFRQKAEKRVLEVTGNLQGKKILLYAPTFRGNVSHAKAPDALDIIKMKETLEEQYVLLIKHHPVVQERPVIPDEAKEFAIDVTERLGIDELICVSDMCISDYSSLIFEYSLFQRPMIFYAYDLEEYGDWRGFYYDYDELTPGPVVRTTEEIIEYILHVEKRFDDKAVKAFRDKFMSACDGRATERIMELVVKRR